MGQKKYTTHDPKLQSSFFDTLWKKPLVKTQLAVAQQPHVRQD